MIRLCHGANTLSLAYHPLSLLLFLWLASRP